MRTLLLLAMLLIAPFAAAADAVLRNAWIALPPPGARVAAGYLVVENRSAAALRIVGAHAAGFARAEVHESYREGAEMKMRPRAALEVAAGARLAFAPGRFHLMLWDPAAPLVAGRGHELTLLLADGGTLSVRATVRDPRLASKTSAPPPNDPH